MSTRNIFFVFLLSPLFTHAQEPVTTQKPETANATTLAVLLANRPERFTEEQWLSMMRKPLGRSLYPLRITQAMLDTLEAEKLDVRYQYVLVPETNSKQEQGPRGSFRPHR